MLGILEEHVGKKARPVAQNQSVKQKMEVLAQSHVQLHFDVKLHEFGRCGGDFQRHIVFPGKRVESADASNDGVKGVESVMNRPIGRGAVNIELEKNTGNEIHPLRITEAGVHGGVGAENSGEQILVHKLRAAHVQIYLNVKFCLLLRGQRNRAKVGERVTDKIATPARRTHL